MFKLIEQNQLIEQDGAQDDKLGAQQAFDGNLATPLKDIFEQGIEGFNGFGTQAMKKLPDLGARILAGRSRWLRGNQKTIVLFTL